ncbi:hypothetical protein BDF21DRAFT_482288 [Thamnidium elegans]|nr:hypothetical protein BDF21DRAFT_482288 [Thamnidium elegans]
MQEDAPAQTICGKGFLKLLVGLSVTILQDAVFLKQLEPTHEMFNNKVFQSSEFMSFAVELNRSIATTTPPAKPELQCIAPATSAIFSDMSLQIQSLIRTQSGNQGMANEELVEAISSKVMAKMEETFESVLVNTDLMPQQSASAITTESANMATGTRRRERDDDEEEKDPRKRYKLDQRCDFVEEVVGGFSPRPTKH